MSYDLAVWEGPEPADDAEAVELFERLVAERDADPERPPTPAIAAFVQDLTNQWPEPPDMSDVDAPWAAYPLIYEAWGPFLHFAVLLDWAEEVMTVGERLARARHLVCFDPGSGRRGWS